MFTFADAILFLGAAQGFILAGLLLFKRRDLVAANRILATILIILSISILLHVLSHVGAFPLGKNHKVLISVLMILNAPLVYLYSVAITAYRFQIEKKHLIHMLPFGIGLLLSLLLLINADNVLIQVKLTRALIVLTFIAIIVYIIAANFVLFRHGKVIRSNFSSLQRINLNWLRVFVGSLTLFWIFAIIIDTFFKPANWDVVWGASCLVIYLIGYFGFVQPEIFSGPFADTLTKASETSKYQKSSLTTDMAEAHFRRLVTAMEKEKLYVDKDISLSSLAQRLGISIHHLSQIINEKTGSNFYDYINAQRIEEAKRMLLDPKMNNRSIASIAFDSGFNSVSAFNAAFKKVVKSTPSQFRKQNSL